MGRLGHDRVRDRGAGHRRWSARRSGRRVISVGLAFIALTSAVAPSGCASAHGEAGAAKLRGLPGRLGSGLSGEKIIVLPLQAIRGGDALGWASSITSPRDFLNDANAQIARALPARAPHTTWLLPADLARTAARNPGYSPDPYTIDAAPLMPDRWKPGGELADPLASQLRSMTSFTDARLALVPVEIRFFPRASEPGPPGPPMGRMVLRVAMVDTRRFIVAWSGDLVSDPAPALSPAMVATLADRLADALATP